MKVLRQSRRLAANDCSGLCPPMLLAAVEAYFKELTRVVASGGATGERSGYVPLANLLNAIGATLKPKVFCVVELANQSAGHPDFGLYAARQVKAGRALGPRRCTRRSLRWREGRAFLPFDTGADVVLRRLLRVGTVVAGTPNDATGNASRLQLARGRMASAGSGVASAFPADFRPRPAAPSSPASTKAKQCRTSTNPSCRHSTLPCASS